jgi:hypothetical protein
MLGWTLVYARVWASHRRSSRMAPCLSNGRLPSLADTSELQDVEIKCKGGDRRGTRREVGDGPEACVDCPGASQETPGTYIVRMERWETWEKGAGSPFRAFNPPVP